MNPGIAPSGLFWTAPVPLNSVHTNPGDGSAVLKVNDIHILDFGDFTNSLSGGPSTPAVKNPSNGFAAEFVRNKAQMEWSAIVGDYSFQSSPLATSSSGFAELATERNGSFYPKL